MALPVDYFKKTDSSTLSCTILYIIALLNSKQSTFYYIRNTFNTFFCSFILSFCEACFGLAAPTSGGPLSLWDKAMSGSSFFFKFSAYCFRRYSARFSDSVAIFSALAPNPQMWACLRHPDYRYPSWWVWLLLIRPTLVPLVVSTLVEMAALFAVLVYFSREAM